MSGGFVKTLVIYGYAVDVWAIDSEGLIATIDELPHLEIHGDDLSSLIYNVEIELEVQGEMEKIWNELGVPDEEEEEEYEN